MKKTVRSDFNLVKFGVLYFDEEVSKEELSEAVQTNFNSFVRFDSYQAAVEYANAILNLVSEINYGVIFALKFAQDETGNFSTCVSADLIWDRVVAEAEAVEETPAVEETSEEVVEDTPSESEEVAEESTEETVNGTDTEQ